jgi:hypothetical protein
MTIKIESKVSQSVNLAAVSTACVACVCVCMCACLSMLGVRIGKIQALSVKLPAIVVRAADGTGGQTNERKPGKGKER